MSPAEAKIESEIMKALQDGLPISSRPFLARTSLLISTTRIRQHAPVLLSAYLSVLFPHLSRSRASPSRPASAQSEAGGFFSYDKPKALVVRGILLVDAVGVEPTTSSV